KRECIRPLTPLTLDDARRLIQSYVEHYNTVRLHSAIGYVTPQDMLAGRQVEIHAARDHKLQEARRQRQVRRQQAPSMLSVFHSKCTMTSPSETEAGSAGTQPDNLAGLIEPMRSSAGADSRALPMARISHRTIDPTCLENPR